MDVPRIVKANEYVRGSRVHIDSKYKDEETANNNARMRESVCIPPIRDVAGKVHLAKFHIFNTPAHFLEYLRDFAIQNTFEYEKVKS